MAHLLQAESREKINEEPFTSLEMYAWETLLFKNSTWSFNYARWIRSRDLLYVIMSVVNNTVLYTWKSVKRVDLILTQ